MKRIICDFAESIISKETAIFKICALLLVCKFFVLDHGKNLCRFDGINVISNNDVHAMWEICGFTNVKIGTCCCLLCREHLFGLIAANACFLFLFSFCIFFCQNWPKSESGVFI